MWGVRRGQKSPKASDVINVLTHMFDSLEMVFENSLFTHLPHLQQMRTPEKLLTLSALRPFEFRLSAEWVSAHRLPSASQLVWAHRPLAHHRIFSHLYLIEANQTSHRHCVLLLKLVRQLIPLPHAKVFTKAQV